MTKWIVALVALVVVSFVGLWLYFRLLERPGEEQTYRVVRTDVGRVARGLGKVETVDAAVSLAFTLPGRLKTVKFREGDRAAAGDMVAELETPGLEYQVAVAEAALQEAKAQAKIVQQAARSQAIQQQEERVARAEKEVAAARLRLKNVQEPVAPPTGQAWQLEAADFAIERARQQLNEALAAQKRLESLPTADELAVADAQVKLAEVDWEDAKEKHRLIVGKYSSHMREHEISALQIDVERQNRKLQLRRNEYDRLKRGPLPAEKEAATARVLAAKAAHEEAVAARKRLEQPPVPHAGTEREVEAARLALEAAQAQEREARAALDLVKAPPREAELALAAAAVSRAEKSLEEVKARGVQTVLKAPFSGVVVTRFLEPGSALAPYTPVVALANLARLQVRAEVDVSWAAEIKAGQEATLTATLMPGAQLTGKICQVLDQIGPKTLFSQDPRETKGGEVAVALIELLPPKTEGEQRFRAALRPGVRMEVEVRFETKRNVLRVPRSYLRVEEGRPVVHRVTASSGDRPTNWEVVPVELGYQTETDVEVTAGLVEGDVLVRPPRKGR